MRLLKSKFISSFLILTLVLVASGLMSLNYAHAGTLSPLSDTMSREKISTASTQVIKFTAATTMVAGQNITMTWPSAFTFTSPAYGDVSMTYGASGTNTTATMAAAPSSGQTFGAVWSGSEVLTISVPTSSWTTPIIATNTIIITIASTHETNPGTAGTYTVSLASSAGDSGALAVPIIGVGGTTDENEVITATVAPTITFTNDHSAIGFGTLSSSTQTYANSTATGSSSDTVANTLAIATNAPSGYTLTYNGATLTGVPSGTISAVGATGVGLNGTPGTSQFAISGTDTGTGSMSTQYNHATPLFAFVPGTTTTLASYGSGPASDSIAMHYLANITSTTPAGSYSTNLTYIATGNF
jgi:hypothetical protein